MQPELERYLSVRTATAGAHTADGSRVAFLTDVTGAHQLWTVPADGGWPDQASFGVDRVLGLLPSNADPALVVFGRDAGGNERAQLHAVAPDGTGEQPLAFDPETIHRLGAFTPDGRWLLYCANDRNGVDFDLYRVPVGGGPAECVRELEGWNHVVDVAGDGHRALVSHARSNTDSDLVLVDLEAEEVDVLTAHEGEARHLPGGLAADGVYLLSDADSDFLEAYRIDLSSRRWERFGPQGWDIEELVVSGGAGALVVNEGGHSRLWLFDPASLALGDEVALPPGVASSLRLSADGARLAFTFSGPRHNDDVWVVAAGGGADGRGAEGRSGEGRSGEGRSGEGRSGEGRSAAGRGGSEGDGGLAREAVGRRQPRRLTRSATAGLDPAGFAEPELVVVPSFDGLEVPAWVYRPAGVEQAPALLSVHGGPEAQARPSFNAVHQYFVARGFAVVVPNVRGSTGYGKRYQSLDDRRQRMDSVADLAEVGRWVRDAPGLDGERIAVMGGSYGGFMVLAALSTYPELWRAGVDIVGIANFVTFLENTGAYRRALREAEYGSLEEDREYLEQISPLSNVERITAPLMVIHGANDPRVPVGEARQIVDRLEGLGREVECIVFDDEGHGLAKLANRRTAYGAVADFLDRHLAGD